mmetsp:Transcript_25044/g.60252  ORF Transcript_25044/g.60252 Transcript_25044/m.60252 type:complete len:517 (+) Transcript_25044:44-1594(+)
MTHEEKRYRKRPKHVRVDTTFPMGAQDAPQHRGEGAPMSPRPSVGSSATMHAMQHHASGKGMEVGGAAGGGFVHTPIGGFLPVQQQQQVRQQHQQLQQPSHHQVMQLHPRQLVVHNPQQHQYQHPVVTPSDVAPPPGLAPVHQVMTQQPIAHQPVSHPPLPGQKHPQVAASAPGGATPQGAPIPPGFDPMQHAHAMAVHNAQQHQHNPQHQSMQPMMAYPGMMAPGVEVPSGYVPIQPAQQQQQQPQQPMMMPLAHAIPPGFVPVQQQQGQAQHAMMAATANPMMFPNAGMAGAPPGWVPVQPGAGMGAGMAQTQHPQLFANPNSFHQVTMPASNPMQQHQQYQHQQQYPAAIPHYQQRHSPYDEQAVVVPSPSPAPLTSMPPSMEPSTPKPPLASLGQQEKQLQSQPSPAKSIGTKSSKSSASKKKNKNKNKPMLVHTPMYQQHHNTTPGGAMPLPVASSITKVSPPAPTFGRQYEYQHMNDGTYLVSYNDGGIKSGWIPMETLPKSYPEPRPHE